MNEVDNKTILEQKLSAAFEPVRLTVVDNSHEHGGHAERAKHGGAHFTVHIVSTHFAGKTPIQRHRMVYDAMGDLMNHTIHALSIRAQTPDESE
jgi:BolA protein